MVRFIQDFEALRFDARQVQRLAKWQKALKKLDIAPDKLGEFIAERGPLETQNSKLRLVNEMLKTEIETNANFKKHLLEQNSALRAVDWTLKTGILNMSCKTCQGSISIQLPTRESYNNLTRTGQVLILICPNCGLPQSLSPWDIGAHIAWILLPTSTLTD